LLGLEEGSTDRTLLGRIVGEALGSELGMED